MAASKPNQTEPVLGVNPVCQPPGESESNRKRRREHHHSPQPSVARRRHSTADADGTALPGEIGTVHGPLKSRYDNGSLTEKQQDAEEEGDGQEEEAGEELEGTRLDTVGAVCLDASFTPVAGVLCPPPPAAIIMSRPIDHPSFPS